MPAGRCCAIAAAGLALAASIAVGEVLVGPLAPPEPPAFREAVARNRQRVAALVATLVPLPESAGRVEVIEARDDVALRKSFIATAGLAGQWSGRAIRVESGGWKLDRLATELADAGLLDCRRRICELRAPLLIEAGASLHIGAAAGSAELRLSPGHGAFIASLGELFIQDAALDGRPLEDDTPAPSPAAAFRPFIVVYDSGHLVIASSRLAHMGYDAPAAYGVTLTTDDRTDPSTDRPSALIHDSEFRDLHYGFYSHAAKGVDIVGNRYVDNVHYGIDPHDGTEDLWIAGNVVRGTRIAHGIIASREVRNIIIHANHALDNAGSGIALDRGVTQAVIGDNVVAGNRGNGITLYESHHIVVAGNRVAGNAGNGIRLRHSSEVWIGGNIIDANGKHGLEASSRTPEREARPEEAFHARPVTLTLAGNRFARNGESSCNFKGIARLDLVPPAPGEALAPCGLPEALAGDQDWLAAIAEAWNRRQPLRIESLPP